MSDVVEDNNIGGAWTLPVSPKPPEVFPRIADAEVARLKGATGGAAIVLLSDMPADNKLLDMPSDGPFVVGSAATTDLIINHESVGAEHFELVATEGQYKVTNLALLQGTWVNEKRIRSQKLVNKDIIRSGCVEFVFLT